MLNGLTDNQVTVHLLGGDLKIHYDQEHNTVYMTGPAAVICDGEICLLYTSRILAVCYRSQCFSGIGLRYHFYHRFDGSIF